MQSKTLTLSVIAVVAVMAVAAVGVGFAYQATYNENTTGSGTADSEYLVVTKGTQGTDFDALSTDAMTFLFTSGVDYTASTDEWSWNSSENHLYLTETGLVDVKQKSFHIVTDEEAADSESPYYQKAGDMVVCAAFLIGDYTVTAPSDTDAVDVKLAFVEAPVPPSETDQDKTTWTSTLEFMLATGEGAITTINDFEPAQATAGEYILANVALDETDNDADIQILFMITWIIDDPDGSDASKLELTIPALQPKVVALEHQE
ncbi:MAG: hypothetical protein E7Z69_06640 [Thermoplasmata archaeon]|nr:hypothetical protein [Thermoplasmata archaeon]